MAVERVAGKEPVELAVEAAEAVEQSEAAAVVLAALLLHQNRHRRRQAIWSLYWR